MTDDPNPVVAQKSNRTTVITIASIVAIFILFVVVLRGAGFLTFTGSDPSSKVVAAALALVGGLVAAIVSIVGLVLKYSIDQRTEMRLQIESRRAAEERKIESDRASALQTQAEQRLGLEAGIRAVELLGGTDGSVNALQRAGALFALSNLEQHQLALDLASCLLQTNGLEPSMACILMDRAIKKGDESTQRQAVDLFYDYADRMVTDSGAVVPDCVFNWHTGLPLSVREWAPYALCRILLARPLTAWQDELADSGRAILSTLILAWEAESTDRIKDNIGAIIRSLVPAYPDTEIIYHPRKSIDFTDVSNRVATSQTVSSRAEQIVHQLEAWRVEPAME